MASTRKKVLASGAVVWQAVWREGPGGEQRQRTRNFSRHGEARAFAHRMEKEIERPRVGDPNRLTVGAYLAEWLADLDPDDYSPTTLDGYGRCVDMATRELGSMELSRLTAHDLAGAYRRLRKHGGRVRKDPEARRSLSKQTVFNIHRCVRTAFEQARKRKLIPENPAADAKAPSVDRFPVVAFTTDEVGRLLELVETARDRDPELQVMVALLLACGLRRSELLGLTFDAIDLDSEKPTLEVARVVVQIGYEPVVKERPKTASSRRVLALPPAAVDLLRQQHARIAADRLAWGRAYRADPLYVFPGPGGGPRIPKSVTQKLRYLLRRAGITKASPVHAWRHTAGTTLFHATKNIKMVQNRLGHSTAAITMNLYVHSTKEADQDAAEHFEALLSRKR
jgi:integrase